MRHGVTAWASSTVVGSLCISAPYPEKHRSLGLAPLVGLSGFPSCLFLENIQWKVNKREKVLQDESCNERLGFFSLEEKAGENPIGAYSFSE